jgi:hypothetical protein
MARSIVPVGFECTAHKVFFQYSNPLSEVSFPEILIRNKRPPDALQNIEEGNEIEEKVDQKSLSSLPPSTPSHLLPTITSFSSYHEICSICLSAYENPVTLVSCHHSFCFHCLFLWLMKKPLCPLCKSSGNYFIQTNRYSSSSASEPEHSDGVKVLSISSDSHEFTSTMIHNAIQVHLTRFPCQEKRTKKRRQTKISPSSPTEREKQKEETTLAVRTVTSYDDEESLAREIERVSADLNEAAERLRDLDHLIACDEEKKRRRKARQEDRKTVEERREDKIIEDSLENMNKATDKSQRLY